MKENERKGKEMKENEKNERKMKEKKRKWKKMKKKKMKATSSSNVVGAFSAGLQVFNSKKAHRFGSKLLKTLKSPFI